MTDQLVQGRNVLDLRPGDVVRERNADWPEPFTAGEFYEYTVAESSASTPPLCTSPSSPTDSPPLCPTAPTSG